MSSKKKRLLHHYAYDPLDRHVKSGGSEGLETQLFYNNDRVATEIKGGTACRIVETEDVVLAQHTHAAGTVDTTLITNDDKRSTLATLKAEQHNAIAYSVYGYSPSDEQRVLGFNGERDDKTTGHYLLGNGYRAFNPVLMRFNSPDSWSPFGEGGINTYAYCGGEPVNRLDPTGHMLGKLKKLFRSNPAQSDLNNLASTNRATDPNTYTPHPVPSAGNSTQQLPAASTRAGSSSRTASASAEGPDQFLAGILMPRNSDRLSFVTRAKASQLLGRPAVLNNGMWVRPSLRIPNTPFSPRENTRLYKLTRNANPLDVNMSAPQVPERPPSTLGSIRTRD